MSTPCAGWSSLLDPDALSGLPPELLRIAGAAGLVAVLLAVFWRPLMIATFDEAYAASIGLPVTAISLGIVIVSAIAAVAAASCSGVVRK